MPMEELVLTTLVLFAATFSALAKTLASTLASLAVLLPTPTMLTDTAIITCTATGVLLVPARVALFTAIMSTATMFTETELVSSAVARLVLCMVMAFTAIEVV